MKRLIALVLLVTPAAAHDFYDITCCSGQDCKPIADNAVKATAGGWLVVSSGEVIGYRDPRVHESPDGRFHRCFVVETHTICLYTPPMGF